MTSSAESTTQAAPVQGRDIGSQISGVFGTVFVWVNSGGLPTAVRIACVLAACAAFVVILVLSLRSYRAQRLDASPAAEAGAGARSKGERQAGPFTRAYWIIVFIEMIALFGGGRLITRVWGHSELGVAWVAFVVGTHFFALAHIFRLARFHLLGAIVTVLGLAGFALWLADALGAIAIVSGVASGFALLAFGLWAYAPKRTQPSA
ncbi:hypothetical protein [Paramicrobacterium fandaimingii]|uniref:hypothetical protein n=1 Tax=Paramicrobacterium fandaimingii TaxID=2708079 RepID=UPI00142236BD|nr:hypothetical protein [Microbacterium fandaimingii]